MSLSAEERETYSKLIDGILAASDLNTISAKRIRKGLQEATKHDLTPQKDAVNELIVERFNIFAPQDSSTVDTPVNGSAPTDKAPSTTASASPAPSSSAKRVAKSEDSSDSIDKSSPPPKKKQKGDSVDADAIYAAKLQAEENARARPTRGGASRKAAPVKKKAKSRTAKKVKAEDDSDLESGPEGVVKKEVNRSGGFHKPMTLSPALSALFGGVVTLSRPQTVKKLWEYIREHQLQDPGDRRHICCDEAMRAVFKQDRVHMFTMTKILNQNLYNPDE